MLRELQRADVLDLLPGEPHGGAKLADNVLKPSATRRQREVVDVDADDDLREMPREAAEGAAQEQPKLGGCESRACANPAAGKELRGDAPTEHQPPGPRVHLEAPDKHVERVAGEDAGFQQLSPLD